MLNLNSADDSYSRLLKRIIQHVQQIKADEQILELMQQAVEQELIQQNIVLSRPERMKLVHQVTKVILNDILAKMNGESAK